LQRQSDDLRAAIASNHCSNIEHLIDKGMPQTIEMMQSSSQQLNNMNTALNKLYHCHCDNLENETLDINNLVKLEIHQLNVPDHINIHVSNLPSIYADHDAMQAIFRAFISNAINSCVSNARVDHKPARIDVSCEQQNDAICFRIQDQGCGIIKEEVNKIFTPFYRGIKSSGYGLGIGLCMAQALLNRYHSPIECKSIINEGSCFTFTWADGQNQ